MPPNLTVLSRIDPSSHEVDSVSEEDIRKDDMDDFNHPRQRRALILQALRGRTGVSMEGVGPADSLNVYEKVVSPGLLEFLETAWSRWEGMGEGGRDALGSMATAMSNGVPPLIPGNIPLPRDHIQRPSKHVIGQMGYYCTDTCTPIFADLHHEMLCDAALMERARRNTDDDSTLFLLTHHPGHHAAYDSFGGYCYVNHVAALAVGRRTAILDVDYHAGNGTASVFYNDPNVLVVSLHCDPDFDYPFHSGFADEVGSGDGIGTTLHLPMPPGTKWDTYRVSLEIALTKIVDFAPEQLVISLGLDTHEGDPCAIRRAGFLLEGDDYRDMGQMLAQQGPKVPTVFVQEGGYRMDVIGPAAATVVYSFAEARGEM